MTEPSKTQRLMTCLEREERLALRFKLVVTIMISLLFDSHASASGQSSLPESPSAMGNPYLFQGARYDAETGFYYFRNRYYDPRHGRFIQRDPVWDELNVGGAYAFVGNGAVTRQDPLGLTLMIRGETITSKSKFYKNVGQEKFTKELLDRMIASKRTYTFERRRDFYRERNMRRSFVEYMKKHADQKAGITYSKDTDDLWAPKGSGWDAYLIYQGNNPAKAFDDLETGPTRMECRRLLNFCLWKALKDTIGAEEFNRRFKGKKIDLLNAPSTTVKRYPPKGSEILPGDHVYFPNVPEYPQDPGYLWKGENAVYLGDDKYTGFGVTSRSGDEIRKELLDAYHKHAPTGPRKRISDIPQPETVTTPNTEYGKQE